RPIMRLFDQPAYRWGAIFGAVIAALGIIDGVVQLATVSDVSPSATSVSGAGVGGLVLTCVFFLVDLALLFLAGMLTARQTATVGSAAIGGLIAGLIGGLVGGIANAVVLLARPNLVNLPGLQGSGIDVHSLLVVSAIFGVVLRAAFIG